MPFNRNNFYLGVNIAWLNHAYQHDFSYSFDTTPHMSNMQPEPLDNRDFQNIVDAYFRHLRFRQIRVVRMWLWETFEGLNFSNFSLRPGSGLAFSQTDRFGIVGWQGFSNRINIVMNAARENNIEIYWTLLNGAGLLPSANPPFWYRALFNHLILNTRDNFKNDILNPFLQCINSSISNVFAIDICNEVDFCWHSAVGLSHNDVVAFILDIYNFIKRFNNNISCTASFASFSELQRNIVPLPYIDFFNFLDFFDYHRYHNPSLGQATGDLAPWADSTPCIIGEAGHAYLPNQPLDEALQASSTIALIEQALQRNYKGIILWRYSPVGDQHRLLKVSANDTAPSSSTNLDVFIRAFINASIRNGPYDSFERPVWTQIAQLRQRHNL